MDGSLPKELLRNLADSTLEIMEGNPSSSSLTLRLTKEIGLETGTIRFTDVSHINLSPRTLVAGIEKVLPSDMMNYWPGSPDYGNNDSVYLIHESWGGRSFIVATGIEYARLDKAHPPIIEDKDVI